MTDRIEQLRTEYGYGEVSEEQRRDMEETRDAFLKLAVATVSTTPYNRAQSLALTKLQEAKMWAVQSIVDGPQPSQK